MQTISHQATSVAGEEDIMSSKNTNKRKKKQYDDNLGGSGTRDYNRNKRLILAGETFRSQKRTGPEKAPSQYRSRF